MQKSKNLNKSEEKKTITLDIGDFSEIFEDKWVSQMFFENSLNTSEMVSSEAAVLNIFYLHSNKDVLKSKEDIKKFMSSISIQGFKDKRKKLLKKLEELKELYSPEDCVPT